MSRIALMLCCHLPRNLCSGTPYYYTRSLRPNATNGKAESRSSTMVICNLEEKNRSTSESPALLPVLVEATLTLIADMLSKDGLEAAETTRSLHIAHNAHNDHGRSLYYSDCLNHLLLVHLCSETEIWVNTSSSCSSSLSVSFKLKGDKFLSQRYDAGDLIRPVHQEKSLSSRLEYS